MKLDTLAGYARDQIRGICSWQLVSSIGIHLPKMTARKRKVLMVDDDPAMLESFDVLLQSWGFDVLQAADAREAKQLVDRHDPDIVISDVVMPEISGLELLRDLKAGNPQRPAFGCCARCTISARISCPIGRSTTASTATIGRSG